MTMSILSLIVTALLVTLSRGTETTFNIIFVSEATASSKATPLNKTIISSIDSIGASFVTCSINGATYSVTIEETDASDLAGYTICEDLKQNIGIIDGVCSIKSVTSGSTTYCTISDTEECKSAVSDTEYEIKILFTSEIVLDKNTLDNYVKEMCNSVTGIGISYTDSTFDSQNGIYKVWINEPTKGLFGNSFNQSFASSEYGCSVEYLKNEDITYYTTPQSCSDPAKYEFVLSVGIPDKYNKETMDKLVTSIIGQSSDMTVVSSELASGTYTVHIDEKFGGLFSRTFCNSIINNEIVSSHPEICFITTVKRNDVKKCNPGSTGVCENVYPDHSTTYSLRIMEDLSSEIYSKSSLDTIFSSIWENVRNLTMEKLFFGNSTYSARMYDMTVYEPNTGVFGISFCEYVKTTDYKCYFEYVRADNAEYCTREIDCPPINYYTLTFLGDNNSVVETKQLRVDDVITFPNAIKSGYLLDEWDTEFTTMPAYNLNVSAKWMKITKYVEITFSTENIKKEDVENVVKKFSNNTFSIINNALAKENGETKVVVEFTSSSSSLKFVKAARAASSSDLSELNIKRVAFAEGIKSFALSIIPLSFIMLLLF